MAESCKALDVNDSAQQVQPQCSDNQTFKVEYKLKRFKTLAMRDKRKNILNKEVEKQKVVGKGKQKVVVKGEEMAKSDEFSKNIKAERFCFSDSLRSRMSPSSVVSVVEACSDAQLKSIRQMGFGSLEYLKVTQLPLHLGLWLVQHFDPKTSSLCIPDCEPLCITEQHVHEVFGFPLGGQDIKDTTTDPNVVMQWKKQFKRNSVSVKLGELASYLKNHNSAGPMFKRNFVVLCVSTLMLGGQNMNVNYSILKYLGDTDKIGNLNWSKYILDHLVDNKIYWDERPTRYSTGSLLFLMGSKVWDSGLKKNDLTIIEKLRMKYCHSILSSKVNGADFASQSTKGMSNKSSRKKKAKN